LQHIFKTGEWKVDTLTLSLYKNELKIAIRPKTFSLLHIFLKNPQRVISKQTILETVWDDVLVSDQVLFQTIRELRNIFEGTEVIKTVPRKGYCWLLIVEKCVEDNTPSPVPPNKVEQQNLTQSGLPYLKNIKKYSTLLVLSIFLLVIFILITNNKNQSEISGSVLVLPVQNKVIGNDHDWVNYGAMDQLINKLKPNDKIAVADLNYVMSSMKLANINQETGFENINRIFEISGAVIVVGSELSGSVEEYRLAYSLYFKNDIKRGVLFGRTVTNVLDQLALLVASYTHQQVTSSKNVSHNEFNNELIARSLEQMQNGNFKLASELLLSLTKIQPHNIIAHRLLAESFMALNQFKLAINSLNQIIPFAIETKSSKLTRLYFFLALSTYNQSATLGVKDEETNVLINKANEYADRESDWLYKAYIAELKAVKESKESNTDIAIRSATKALEFFNVVRCPIGTSRVELFLSQLYKIKGDNDKRKYHLEKSQMIVEQRRLDSIL